MGRPTRRLIFFYWLGCVLMDLPYIKGFPHCVETGYNLNKSDYPTSVFWRFTTNY